jgi:hypothetical protein
LQPRITFKINATFGDDYLVPHGGAFGSRTDAQTGRDRHEGAIIETSRQNREEPSDGLSRQ